MNSLKSVSKYETVCSGNLEWEIQDVSLHFQKCEDCWQGKDHPGGCSPSDTFNMKSAPMKLATGDGKESKWDFTLSRDTTMESKDFCVSLNFDGLFGSDGAEIPEALDFTYNFVVQVSALDKLEILYTVDGKELMDHQNGRSESIHFEFLPVGKLQSVWPHGNLRLSAKITHFSNSVNEVFNNAEEQFLDFIDLKDQLPAPLVSCYGNLLNNPDLSDFKIICEGSIFHAHKFILSVRSRVFRVMIESGLMESVQNELKIVDMNVKTVELMLEYIYKGTVEYFPEDLKDGIELLNCAEKYELDELKFICMRKIFSNLPTEKEVGELATAASKYGENSRATRAIKDFCTANHAKLVKDPEFKKMFLANPQIFMH